MNFCYFPIRSKDLEKFEIFEVNLLHRYQNFFRKERTIPLQKSCRKYGISGIRSAFQWYISEKPHFITVENIVSVYEIDGCRYCNKYIGC